MKIYVYNNYKVIGVEKIAARVADNAALIQIVFNKPRKLIYTPTYPEDDGLVLSLARPHQLSETSDDRFVFTEIRFIPETDKEKLILDPGCLVSYDKTPLALNMFRLNWNPLQEPAIWWRDAKEMDVNDLLMAFSL